MPAENTIGVTINISAAVCGQGALLLLPIPNILSYFIDWYINLTTSTNPSSNTSS